MTGARTSKTRIRQTITRLDALLGIMACLSILILFIPKDWAKRSIQINPQAYPASLSDDTYSNGNSTASWLNKDHQHWRCELREEFRNPYCSMLITLLDDNWKGLDLREFNTIRIKASYSGPGDFIRIYLRNRHPRYYVVGNPTSTKYNMVEVPVKELSQGYTLNLSDFTVADWWVSHNKLTPKDSHVEFNDIIYIEVQTGSGETSGIHDIQMQNITWHGDLISNETLYKAIIIVWSGLIFFVLLYRLITLKWELSKNQKYQKELLSINKLLNLQNKQFEDMAKTDQLTGLLNRVGIRDMLYQGLSDWKEHHNPFSLVMIDIDHFKQVNDNHGHDAGDKVLQMAGELFKNNIRRSDAVARWGGEEFILVSPGSDSQQAQIVAELLRKKIESTPGPNGIKITASFGVAAISEPNLEHLFKYADQALYEAKNNGRNKVVTKD